jgi:dTDP-4-dehydrorhamnose reductase
MSGKLLIFGGGGFVGGNLATVALRQGWEVHVSDRGEYPGLPGVRWHLLDVTDSAAVRRLAAELRPQAVVDLAAVADIDLAEREQARARAVNAEAAGVIASACAGLAARCVYFSSDAVFAGTAQSYSEEDPPAPVNWYGRTKAEGERAVLACYPRAVVVRISLALGFPVARGNSFLAALEARLRAGQAITVPSDEVRTPIDVRTLAECVLELLRLDFSGVLHLGSTDSIDRAELTRRAARLLGFPEARVLAGSASSPGRAARHKNGILRVDKARALLKTPLRSAEDSLRRAISERLA